MSIYKKPGTKFWWYGFTFLGQRVQGSTKVENRKEAVNIEKAKWVQLARAEVGIKVRKESRVQNDRPTA